MDMTIATLRFLPQGTDEWKELTKGDKRIFDVTASIAASIVGVGYDSPIMQWKKDCGLVTKTQDSYLQQSLLNPGIEDEDAVVDQFIAWWNQNVGRPLAVYKTGTWQHPKYPWLAASPDRYMYDIEMDDVYLLEAKSRQEDRDAKHPCDGHFVQCQLQMSCIPEAKGLFYVSANVRSKLTDCPMRLCAIQRDEAFVEREVIPKLQAHRTLVANRVPPTKQARKPHFLSYRTARVTVVYPDGDVINQ